MRRDGVSVATVAQGGFEEVTRKRRKGAKHKRELSEAEEGT